MCYFLDGIRFLSTSLGFNVLLIKSNCPSGEIRRGGTQSAEKIDGTQDGFEQTSFGVWGCWGGRNCIWVIFSFGWWCARDIFSFSSILVQFVPQYIFAVKNIASGFGTSCMASVSGLSMPCCSLISTCPASNGDKSKVS